jgi:hypothetical protein
MTFLAPFSDTQAAPEWSGQLGMASNTNSLFVNVGGPGLRFLMPDREGSISLSFLPSLRLPMRADGITRPVFGLGAGYYRKRFGFIVPVYSVPNEGWMVAAGLAYRFSAE